VGQREPRTVNHANLHHHHHHYYYFLIPLLLFFCCYVYETVGLMILSYFIVFTLTHGSTRTSRRGGGYPPTAKQRTLLGWSSVSAELTRGFPGAMTSPPPDDVIGGTRELSARSSLAASPINSVTDITGAVTDTIILELLYAHDNIMRHQ